MSEVLLSNPLPNLAHSSVVFDRTACGRIRLAGADRVRFLHNQTTQNIEQLAVGQGCYTVFVTSTGRTLDLATVYAFVEDLLVVVSPGMAKPLYDWMDRYIFFSDKVTLTDESEQTFFFTVMGQGAADVVRSLGATECLDAAPFSHQSIPLGDAAETLTLATGSDLTCDGYSLWGPKTQADTVWRMLLSAGAIAGTAEQWEALRIQQGRPAPGQELTDDDNPLEAGLWHSISFEKGCYIGQETIARLNTYKGVKKRLWGLKLSEEVSPGAAIFAAGAKIGRVTSVTEAAGEVIGLGYLRTKAGGAGLRVEVERAEGEMIAADAIALPFISHEYYEPKAAAPSQSMSPPGGSQS